MVSSPAAPRRHSITRSLKPQKLTFMFCQPDETKVPAVYCRSPWGGTVGLVQIGVLHE
jgi:hypothetical protein